MKFLDHELDEWDIDAAVEAAFVESPAYDAALLDYVDAFATSPAYEAAFEAWVNNYDPDSFDPLDEYPDPTYTYDFD